MKKENHNSSDELRRIKTLFEAIWGNSSIAIYETDADGQCVSVNNEWCKFAGISKEDALGGGWQQALHPDDRGRIFALWNKHAKTGEVWNLEYRFQTPENVITWVLGKSVPIVNKQGEITGYLGVNTDITERKLAEDALNDSRLLLLSSLESQTDSILFSIDNNYRYLYFNRAHCDVMKKAYGLDIAKGMNILDCITNDDDRKAAKANYDRALKGESHTNVRIFGEDHLAYYESFLNPIKNDKNEIIGATGLARDITDRKQKEAEVLAITDQWQATFDSVNDAIWLLDKEHNILRSNKQADILFGTENIGKKCYNTVHGTKCPIEGCPVQLAFKHKCRKRMELQIGNNWYDISADPILDVNGNVTSAVHIVRDITTQRKLEDELRFSEKHLTELNATKDKLFSIIAHDLKNPLHSILGFSDLLIKKIQTSDIEKLKKFATIINTSAKSNLHLLENLLAWGKTQTEQIEFTPKNLELHRIVEEVFLLLNSSASLKNIKLISSLSDVTTVYADQNMLSTILRNLITNAIKFSNSEGEVDICAIAKQDHIEISVADNGVGINKENQGKLFGADLNFTLRGTENESGSGLGLSLCKEFVEKHDGKIWAESEVGIGSKFVFTLPVFKK